LIAQYFPKALLLLFHHLAAWNDVAKQKVENAKMMSLGKVTNDVFMDP
jgi:hypothetical protein